VGNQDGAKPDFFFVPLGRERGGYLDLLGLPPDADVTTVGRRELEYWKKSESDFKQGRSKLKDQLQKGKITQEEFDAEVEALKSARTKRDAELNEKKQKYGAAQAERRELVREGRADESSPWAAMCVAGVDRQTFWKELTKPRGILSAEPQWLAAVERRWVRDTDEAPVVAPGQPDGRCLDVLADLPYLTQEEVTRRQRWFRTVQARRAESKRAELQTKAAQKEITKEQALAEWTQWQAEAKAQLELLARRLEEHRAADRGGGPGGGAGLGLGKDALGRSRFFAPEGVDVATVVRLAQERDLIRLLCADALWEEVRYTNREHWQQQLDTWAQKSARPGPWLRRQSDGEPVSEDDWEYPALCRPVIRSIDRLEARELGEISKKPDRSGAVHGGPDPALAALMKALLGAGAAGQARAEPQPDATRGKRGRPIPLEEFKAMLADLARRATGD